MFSPPPSLAGKFVLGTAAGLLASSLVFLVLFVVALIRGRTPPA